MQNIEHILTKIESIDLTQMEGVKLMDRTDTKFTFEFSKLSAVFNDIAPYYFVLDIESKRIFHYKTLYYDTEDLNLYTRHHNGHLNRYKIRHRTYLETNTAYLEVKFKSNKGRTVKERIKQASASSEWNTGEKKFLDSKLPFDPANLKPCLWVNYSRITLVNKKNAERVTIDLKLNFEHKQKQQYFNNLVIAEVKQEKKQESFFLETMKKLKIKEGSISKYCMGVVVMNHDVKRNNFKEKIQSLKHITGYDFNTITS